MSESVFYTDAQSKNILHLQHKLMGLKVKAHFSRLEEGPVITAYYFKLDSGESVKKFLSKSEDLALALGAEKIICQRVGGEIAIFIPNKDRKMVDFKEILHWYLHDPATQNMSIPVPLGVDYHGTKSSIDLADMPHMLITGSTGSGKSVFEAGIITSLCYNFDSSDMQLYLVDTKKLDLPLFKDMPHVRDCADTIEHFHNMISYIMQETRRRNTVLQGASCRNIREYHKFMGERKSMPWIIVMIDEFGDLMELDNIARKEGKFEDTPTVKQWIKSAGQICRAAGVHLICCTQRASVKVVDGDIKTNLPCRITLRLPTAIDSRTIIGESGAENLLGKGDMLIQQPGEDIIKRYHGPFVRTEDISELVMNYNQIKDYIKA